MRLLGDHLGPLFLQVSERFDNTNAAKLYAHLHTLPSDLKFFLEVRHHSWFANDDHFNHLRELKSASVINDTPAERKAVHMQRPTLSSDSRRLAHIELTSRGSMHGRLACVNGLMMGCRKPTFLSMSITSHSHRH